MIKMSFKAVLVTAMILLSFAAFAVDFSASTVLKGDIWGTDGFKLNNENQKDADLLTVTVSDELWGSTFRLWAPLLNNLTVSTDDISITDSNGDDVLVPGAEYPVDGADGGIVDLRKLSIWVQPISMLKITVGAVTSGLYTEQLNWWQVPNGAINTDMGWSSDTATAGDGGVNLEFTPMNDLWILAGISPGIGNMFLKKDGGDLVIGENTNFGLAAKYTIADFGSVGVAYRNNGGRVYKKKTTWNEMNGRVGFDVTAVPGLYAFLQGIFTVDAGADSLSAVTIDNYVAYTAGDFSVKATLPVTIRVTGDDGDYNYMSFDVKAGYTVMENVTPFLRLTQQESGALLLTSDKDVDDKALMKIMPVIQVGADYSLGSVTFMTALQINTPDPSVDDAEITWSVPFEMRASW
jgi:hypothetical protein